MRVREVIPLRKTDEKMETRERGKKQNCGDRERNIFRGMFAPTYPLLVICMYIPR